MMTPPPRPGIEPLEARIAPASFLVTTTADSGPGSLRQAILDANDLPGSDSIQFSFGGKIIMLKTHLPAITNPISINGTSGGGSVTIDGTLAAAADGTNNGSGLMLEKGASGSSIRYLAIYGFDIAGIEIVGSSNNIIELNKLGVSASGGTVKSKMAAGVLINGGSGNRIGGTQSGNLIGGNEIGIRVTGGATSTVIDGNNIGVLPNNYGVLSNDIGVLVETASGTQIGSTKGNVIAANHTFGIKLSSGASDTRIVRNTIGLAATDVRVGTQEWGIFADGARNTTIGAGTYLSQLDQANKIVGNTAGGIWVRPATSSSFTSIAGNIIGKSSANGTSSFDFGNGGPGILVTREAGFNSELREVPTVSIISNLISGNAGAGIEFRSLGSGLKTTILGNMIGADFQGTSAIGNGAGIIVDGTDGVTIGGQGTIMPNTIVGSRGDGILIRDSNNVSILEAHIGYSLASKAPIALGNAGHGIHLVAVGKVDIGTSVQKARPNTIASNGGDGIFLDGDALGARKLTPNVTISGNYIGKDGMGNKGAGIHIADLPTKGTVAIGQMNDALGNTIIDNREEGILVESSRSLRLIGNHVSSPEIALRLDGAIDTSLFGNDFQSDGRHAVVFDHGTSGTRFGDFDAGNHVIGAGAGLLIDGGNNNSVVNNRIEAQTAAIVVLTGENAQFSRNEFHVPDDGLFVDLGGDGVTPNDPLDADTGPNNLQNSPLLVSAALSGGQTLLRGEYRGAVQSEVRIEWYVNGEFLAETSTHTDDNGVARLALDLDHALEAGAKVSASATSDSNTSEFSAAVEAKVPAEVIAKGAAAGQKPRVQLRDAATGELLVDQLAFGKGFRGGVRVTTADVDGDGFTDLIATARTGSGAVKVFSGLDGHLINQFQMGPANDRSIRSIAAGDLDGDGTIEVVIGRALTMGGRVLVHDALTGALESRHTPFGFNTPDSLNISLSDTDRDNLPEIVIRAEVLGGMRRVVLDPISGRIEQLARLVRG